MNKPSNIVEFDTQDRDLFGISDLQLRADALKHSVLPRLQELMNRCIAMVRDIYGVEVFDDSIVSLSPNFRPKREQGLKVDYQLASACLGGKRKAGLWSGVQRKDGRVVQIVPYLYGFDLSADGLRIALFPGFAKGLTAESKRRLLNGWTRHATLIADLCQMGAFELVTPDVQGAQHIMSMSDRLALYACHLDVDWLFIGDVYDYPVKADEIGELMFRFAVFFPLYDQCLRYAKGRPERFLYMVEKLNTWLASMETEPNGDDDLSAPPPAITRDLLTLGELRSKVMPGLRWQVFQRDGWRCVACGRQSHDGILLHVDHVLPRSKGGKDKLDNLQTLCGECNIGKGNRDATNLRRRPAKA